MYSFYSFNFFTPFTLLLLFFPFYSFYSFYFFIPFPPFTPLFPFLLLFTPCVLEGKGKVELVIYFDEAHVLTNVTMPQNQIIKTCTMQSVTALISLWIIPFLSFFSTTSYLRKLAPSGPLARSAHACTDLKGLQAPITEVPYDVSQIFPLHSVNALWTRFLLLNLCHGLGGHCKLTHSSISLLNDIDN